MNFKKIIIGIVALVAIVAVAFGVKSQFSHKEIPQERGNSLVSIFDKYFEDWYK